MLVRANNQSRTEDKTKWWPLFLSELITKNVDIVNHEDTLTMSLFVNHNENLFNPKTSSTFTASVLWKTAIFVRFIEICIIFLNKNTKRELWECSSNIIKYEKKAKLTIIRIHFIINIPNRWSMATNYLWYVLL